MPQADRIAIARLTGIADRYGWGHRRDWPTEEGVAALHEVSSDPTLLGLAAGASLASPHEHRRAAAELLRAAGADMTVAEEHAAEIRERLPWLA
jgi:hypothetical protein